MGVVQRILILKEALKKLKLPLERHPLCGTGAVKLLQNEETFLSLVLHFMDNSRPYSESIVKVIVNA